MQKVKIQKTIISCISWGAILILVWAMFSTMASAQNDAVEMFTTVETMPVFAGCEGFQNYSERRKCSNEKLLRFVELVL